MENLLFALAALAGVVAIVWFCKNILCLQFAAATAAVTAAKVQGPNGGVSDRTERVPFAADTGTLYNGVLVGRNSDGYYMKAGNAEALTDICLYVGQRYEVDSAGSDGDYVGDVQRGIVVPVTIATLSTAAAARAAYGQPVYAYYDNEVTLSRATATYENFVGFIVGHNSVTEVLVFIPLVQRQGTIDFARFDPTTAVDGSMLTTGNNWIAFSTANARGFKALLSYTGTSGDFNAWCLRARSNSAYPVVCVNASASAGQNDFGNLYALQGYAQPNAYTQTDASNIVCAVYGCVDQGGANVGRTWVAWFDTHMTVKSSGGSYLMRLSHNGTVANDGAITIYDGGRMPVLFNFEDAAGMIVESAGTYSTADGYINIKTPSGTRRIAYFAAVD